MLKSTASESGSACVDHKCRDSDPPDALTGFPGKGFMLKKWDLPRSGLVKLPAGNPFQADVR